MIESAATPWRLHGLAGGTPAHGPAVCYRTPHHFCLDAGWRAQRRLPKRRLSSKPSFIDTHGWSGEL